MNGPEDPVVIIGGGVAGLCAAIELSRQGLFSVVLEAHSYPAHKVCGEFLSPECLDWLRGVNIPVTAITEAQVHIEDGQPLVYALPSPAGGLSHHRLDPLLAAYALTAGITLRTHTRVQALRLKQNRQEKHSLNLCDGTTLHASSLIIAAGRLPSLTTPDPVCKYVGIKAHFEGIDLGQAVQLFGFPGAYLGVSPIEEGRVNLACLARAHRVHQAGSIELLMSTLIAQAPRLQGVLSRGRPLFDWMSTPVPHLGFKRTAAGHDLYFIGDAAVSIPPAGGLGLTLAIASGTMVARYVVNRDHEGFKKAYRCACSAPLLAAKGLHYLLMHPLIGQRALQICKWWPALPHRLFQASRFKHVKQAKTEEITAMIAGDL